MLKSSFFEVEEERLKALMEYEVLDSPQEDSFDDLTFLASIICKVPIVLITFIDGNRQWFKSKIGTEITETPRDVSFCTHAIKQDSTLIIPDMTQDLRFANNPLVTGSTGIRFYAGAQLKTPEGHKLGTFCVLDNKVNTLNHDQQRALEALARQVMKQLDFKKQISRLREKPKS